jgi:F-type H+-transporting ATPase subunit alpha
MKKVAGRLKLEMAQYRELAAFAQFGTSELDKATRAQLERGQRITELLKQPQYKPETMENQVMVLYAAINGYIDDVPLDRIAAFEENLYRFMEANHPKVGQAIVKDGELSKETEAALKEAIDEFKKGFATK